MRWDAIKMSWDKWAEKIHTNFSELSEKDLKAVDSDQDRLMFLIQRTYGWSEVRAERELGTIFGAYVRGSPASARSPPPTKIGAEPLPRQS